MTRLTEPEDDEMNRILSREEEILPSSGFAVSVMDAIRREAAAPPPIPFPWKRALPGLVVGGFGLALALVTVIVAILLGIRASMSAQFSVSSSVLTSILESLGGGFQRNLEGAACWTVLALLVAFVSVKLSMHLASGRA
jgi:hypothetical protein